MKRLILIRHGETDYTLQNRYCGHEDVPLNKRGIRQAGRLRRRLKKIKIDIIYSSDLDRALQTAKIIFKNRTIFKKKALREIDFGRLSGLTPKETKRLYPDIYKLWACEPMNIRLPAGEDFNNFSKRVIRSYKDISNLNAKRVVAIVSHGGVIRVILLKLMKLDFNKIWQIRQDVAAFNLIEFKNGMPKTIKTNIK